VNPRPRIFDILKDCDDDSADRALADGALHVSPTHRREILKIILKRGNEAGLKTLPVLFSKLDPEAQSLIITNASRLFGALRAGIRNSGSQTRLNTLEIIRRSGSLRLAYLATLAIHDGSPKVRAEAAITLQHLAAQHSRNYADTTAALHYATEPDGSLSRAIVQTLKLLRDERRYLIAAIQEALDNYESHHRPEIIEAAMFLADELEDVLFQQNTLKRGKLTHAMIEVFTSSLSPRLVPFTYIALCYPELRRRIIAILATHRDAQFFAEFIRHHWLARDPAIRKNLVAIRSLAWLGDGLEAAFSLPEEVATITPCWLLSLGISSDQKVSVLLNFLLIDNQSANRAAVLALTKIDTPTSTLALQGVLDHEDPTLTAIAEREIEHRELGERQLPSKPHSDRPSDWCDMLQQAGMDEGFDDLWRRFDRLHPVQAKATGHYAFKYVPGFMTQLQVKLLSPQAPDRLRALRLITVLHVADRFQNDVFAAANDPTPEVRAFAMTALAHIGGATSRRILERAFSDNNPTVQAGAIDALDRMGAKQRAELIIPKVDSEDPNVRAAATRVLLKMKNPKGAAALISMLQDSRVEHQCAALWIVDQLRLVTAASRVLELENNEDDPRIARIAKHVGKQLRRLQKTANTDKVKHDRRPKEIRGPAATTSMN